MGYEKETVVNAPIAKVWAAWTSTEEAERWLAPRANVVFAVGKPYEFFWDDDPALDSTLGCNLLEVDPESRLVFEWQGKTDFLPMFEPERGGRTTVAVEFSQVEDGVRVRVVQEEIRDLEDWAAYDAWMAAAWEMALGGLKAYCEEGGAKPYWHGDDEDDCSSRGRARTSA